MHDQNSRLNRTHAFHVALALSASVALVYPHAAAAQDRGRTDGPEGSEYGKGGYEPVSGLGAFSLELDWGAAIAGSGSDDDDGTPMFFGLTAGYWPLEFLSVDLSGNYNLLNDYVDVFIGPRFRTYTRPLAFSAGLKAGPIIRTGDASTVRFGLSPQVGADLVLDEHLLLGLKYAYDLPIGGDLDSVHRVYMNIGYRF